MFRHRSPTANAQRLQNQKTIPASQPRRQLQSPPKWQGFATVEVVEGAPLPKNTALETISKTAKFSAIKHSQSSRHRSITTPISMQHENPMMRRHLHFTFSRGFLPAQQKAL